MNKKLFTIDTFSGVIYNVIAKDMKDAIALFSRKVDKQIMSIRERETPLIMEDSEDEMNNFRDACKAQLKTEVINIIDNFNY